MVGYGEVKQWKIYNYKTKSINISAFICFDKSFIYNNISYEITNKDNNGVKLNNLWNKVNDEKFSKVMAEKQVIKKNNTLAHSTPQSGKKSVITDSKVDGENNCLPELAINNNYILLNQPILSPIVPNKFLSSLINIFKTNILLLPKIFYNSKEKEDFLESTNLL